MALKKKLSKDEFAKLSDAVKSEYIEDGEGYRLDIEGDEDTGALKRAKDREAQLRRDAEAKLKEAQAELDKLSGDDARKKGDIQTLEKAWEKKNNDQKAEYEGKLKKLNEHIQKQLVDSVAMQVANKISNAPNLLLPHIKSRLQADFEGESPLTRVLDKDGKLSALTVEDLTAEFVANKDFSAIITASKATGGASKPSFSSGSATNDHKPVDLSTLNPAQLAQHIKDSKTTK